MVDNEIIEELDFVLGINCGEFKMIEAFNPSAVNTYYVNDVTCTIEDGVLILDDDDGIIFEKTKFLGLLVDSIEAIYIEKSRYSILLSNNNKIIIEKI